MYCIFPYSMDGMEETWRMMDEKNQLKLHVSGELE